MNSFECPNCKESLELEDDMLGQEGICPFCDAQINIPGSPPATQSTDGPPQLSLNRPQEKNCPNCNASMNPDAVLCVQCGHDLRTGQDLKSGKGNSKKGYSPAKITAPGATGSLVCGIISLCSMFFGCCCPFLGLIGVILGAISVYQGLSARKLCAQNDRFVGEGMALAGLILGIIGIVINLLITLLMLVGMVADGF